MVQCVLWLVTWHNIYGLTFIHSAKECHHKSDDYNIVLSFLADLVKFILGVIGIGYPRAILTPVRNKKILSNYWKNE